MGRIDGKVVGVGPEVPAGWEGRAASSEQQAHHHGAQRLMEPRPGEGGPHRVVGEVGGGGAHRTEGRRDEL